MFPLCSQRREEKEEVPHSGFPGWIEVLHPSQTMIPTRQAPLTLDKLRQWCHSQSVRGRRAQHQGAEECRQAMQEKSDSTSSPESWILYQSHTTPRLKGVATCLLRDLPSLAPIEVPPEPRQPDTLGRPTVATAYATWIVLDKATGVTYMDMVTTLVERVTLRNPCMVANLLGPTVEDITDLLEEQRQMATQKQSNYGVSHQHMLRPCKFTLSVSIKISTLVVV